MKVVTEVELRDKYKKAPFTSFTLDTGTVLTPAAAQFLSERRISLERRGEAAKGGETPAAEKGFVLLRDNSVLSEKPEHLTHLYGKYLVDKSHPRITFRGGVDRLTSLLIETILYMRDLEEQEVSRDLREVLEMVRLLFAAEVKGDTMPEVRLFGLRAEELHDRSHHPHRYYRIQHFIPQPEHGPAMARLNLIRTEIRAVELLAMHAFYKEKTGVVERPDIILSLNRLSSALYVLMCNLLEKQFNQGQ